MSLGDTLKWALRALDTPNRNEIVHGYGPRIWGPDTPGHMWYCGRCRSSDHGIETPAAAEHAAREHADTHRGMWVYLSKGR